MEAIYPLHLKEHQAKSLYKFLAAHNFIQMDSNTMDDVTAFEIQEALKDAIRNGDETKHKFITNQNHTPQHGC
jgi:low affinity Fe/Cu permease